MAQTEYRYPCESCGASLRFAPGEAELVCPYCGHRQQVGAATADLPQTEAAVEDGPNGIPRVVPAPRKGGALQWDSGHKSPGLREIPLAEGLALDRAPAELTETIRTLSCPNCGAKFNADAGHQASLCPFCATPVVTDTGAERLIKPQGTLPFAITEAAARAALEKWFKGLWFAPNGLAQYARRGRRMAGVYSPFWTFDAETRTRYDGARGDYYYETVWVTRQVNGRSQQVAEQRRHVRWTPVSGRVARSFDDVLVLASTALPRSITDALAPWDLSALRDFRPDYLAGFDAEGYTVHLAAGRDIAHDEMAGVILGDVRRAIGGDVQRIGSIATDHENETFKHILLPVWTAAYKYNGKSYRFVVNGQSGRVQGERPWSVWKLALLILAILAALALVMALGEGNGSFDFGALAPPGVTQLASAPATGPPPG